MDIRIDAAAGLVDAEDARFPLTLDCRDGTARLHCGEVIYVLRPLRWREKANLARFAHLGAAFLDEAFLRLSLLGDPVLPDDARARQALSRLAEWLNASGRERSLPLDPLLLGRAAAALCRGLGLRPQDLDDLPADEVEALWAAIDTGTEQGPSPGRRATSAGFSHRIEIVPDQTDANEAPAGRVPPEPNPAAECVPASAPPDRPTATAGPFPVPSGAPARPSAVLRPVAPIADRPARPAPEMNCEAGGPPALPSPDNRPASRARFRVVTSRPPAAAKSSAPLSAAAPSSLPPSRAPLSQLSLSPMPPAFGSGRGSALPAEMAAPGAADPAVSGPEAPAHAPTTAPAALASMAADVESLLDAFAERLAEAAMLLGIDEV